MKMYDLIKETKKATLIIIFTEDKVEQGPISFTILSKTIKITKDQSLYTIPIEDKSINENKVYECFLQYESERPSYNLKVNYGQDNYYVFDRKKNNKSFEFIFADFANQKINNNRCYIKYNGKKYFANDDNNFSRLRCLNLINVDLNLIELPLSYENQDIQHNIFNDTSYLIFVSVVEENRKIFGIYQNKPFIENDLKFTGNQITEKLRASIDTVKSILNYSTDKNFYKYMKEIDMIKKPTLDIEIKNSIKLEEEIFHYFNFYRPNPTEEELLAFDTYSEFMMSFPIFENMEDDNQNIETHKFIKQYYYSHKIIENFEKTIPSKVDRKERIFLKYSACRCLRILLRKGNYITQENIFYFCDLNEPNTIYNEAKKFNEIFIDNLTEDSEMFLFLLQINSGSSINKLTNDLTARISMLKLEQIKEHLRNSIPNYVIRINYRCDFKGQTFNEVKYTLISELNLFNNFLDETELNIGDTDKKYNKRLILSNLLQHERFGHIKFSLNFYSFKQDKGKNLLKLYNPIDNDDEPSSPRQFYQIKNEEKFNEITQPLKYKSGEEVKVGEAGIAFNVFLTRNNKKNMDILRFNKADFTKIFQKPELFAANDLTSLNKLIEESAPNFNLKNFQFEKVSEGKYELNLDERFSFDLIPTTAKYYH